MNKKLVWTVNSTCFADLNHILVYDVKLSLRDVIVRYEIEMSLKAALL